MAPGFLKIQKDTRFLSLTKSIEEIQSLKCLLYKAIKNGTEIEETRMMKALTAIVAYCEKKNNKYLIYSIKELLS